MPYFFSHHASTHAKDSASRSWIDHLPRSWQPFAHLGRFDRPVGMWLLFWPCAWGLASGDIDTQALLFWYMPLFLIGSFSARSAGCVYNDIIDRKLDAKVARTRHRPLACNQISLLSAWIWLGTLALLSLCVFFALPVFARKVTVFSLFLVFAYPFMKRLTWWPQAWLGLTFNWGVFVGAATAHALTFSSTLLYVAGIFWTLGYDTIYAVQDRQDDEKAGIKSSARRLGPYVPFAVMVFYALTLFFLGVYIVLSFGAVGLFALMLPAAHFIWQWKHVKRQEQKNALKVFRSNSVAGGLIFLAVILGKYLLD